MPDSGPLRPFESLASSLAPLFPLELLVQRPPRCSDGDRPYLTAAATAALNRVGRVEGEPTRASEAGTWRSERETEMERETTTLRKGGGGSEGGWRARRGPLGSERAVRVVQVSWRGVSAGEREEPTEGGWVDGEWESGVWVKRGSGVRLSTVGLGWGHRRREGKEGGAMLRRGGGSAAARGEEEVVAASPAASSPWAFVMRGQSVIASASAEHSHLSL